MDSCGVTQDGSIGKLRAYWTDSRSSGLRGSRLLGLAPTCPLPWLTSCGQHRLVAMGSRLQRPAETRGEWDQRRLMATAASAGSWRLRPMQAHGDCGQRRLMVTAASANSWQM